MTSDSIIFFPPSDPFILTTHFPTPQAQVCVVFDLTLSYIKASISGTPSHFVNSLSWKVSGTAGALSHCLRDMALENISL